MIYNTTYGKLYFNTQFTRKDFPPEAEIQGAKPEPHWRCSPFSMSCKSGPDEESNFDAFIDHLEEVDPKRSAWCIATFLHWDVTWCDFVFYDPEHKAIQEWVNHCTEVLKEDGMLDWELFHSYKMQSAAEKGE